MTLSVPLADLLAHERYSKPKKNNLLASSLHTRGEGASGVKVNIFTRNIRHNVFVNFLYGVGIPYNAIIYSRSQVKLFRLIEFCFGGGYFVTIVCFYEGL